MKIIKVFELNRLMTIQLVELNGKYVVDVINQPSGKVQYRYHYLKFSDARDEFIHWVNMYI